MEAFLTIWSFAQTSLVGFTTLFNCTGRGGRYSHFLLQWQLSMLKSNQKDHHKSQQIEQKLVSRHLMLFVRHIYGFLCSSFVSPGIGATVESCRRARLAKLNVAYRKDNFSSSYISILYLQFQQTKQQHHILLRTKPATLKHNRNCNLQYCYVLALQPLRQSKIPVTLYNMAIWKVRHFLRESSSIRLDRFHTKQSYWHHGKQIYEEHQPLWLKSQTFWADTAEIDTTEKNLTPTHLTFQAQLER